MKRIPFKNVYNFRDLGGIPISLTSWIKEKEFYRSDALLDLSSEEIIYMKDLGIKTIIDLRSHNETSKKPNILMNNQDFNYYHIPFLDRNKATDVKQNTKFQDNNLFDVYKEIITNHQYEIKCVFDCILNNLNVAIVYHCSAGKDRTGIISVLLLMLANVNPLDIIADYEVSFTYLLPRLYELKKNHPNIPMNMMETKNEYIEYIIDYINNEQNGIINFLLNIGLTNEEIERIKNKLY